MPSLSYSKQVIRGFCCVEMVVPPFLHLVIERGWVKAARSIAAREMALLNEDNHDCTPLHYAAASNNWEIINLLLNQCVFCYITKTFILP